MRVLVIYSEEGKEVVATVTDMTEKEYKFFSTAHNKCMNVSDIEEDDTWFKALLVINLAFNNVATSTNMTDVEKKYNGKWKHMAELPDISDIDKLIITSWL